MSKKQYNEEDFSGISDMLEGKHHVIPIVSNEDEEEAENTEVPDTLPILTLRAARCCSPARSRRSPWGASAR